MAVAERRKGDADAGIGDNILIGQPERPAQKLVDAPRHLFGLVLGVDIFEEYRKLIAAEPGNRVDLADAVAQTIADFDQHLVAVGMAKAVIDHLEPVKIQKHDGKQEIRIAHCPRNRLGHAVGEQCPVGQSGERIMERIFKQLMFGMLVLVDVAERSGNAGRLTGRIADCEPARQHPPVGAVVVQHPVLANKIRGFARKVGFERRAEYFLVLGMDVINPRLDIIKARLFVEADHRFPARRNIGAVTLYVPVPDAVVGALHRQLKAVFAFADGFFGQRALDRDAQHIGHGFQEIDIVRAMLKFGAAMHGKNTVWHFPPANSGHHRLAQFFGAGEPLIAACLGGAAADSFGITRCQYPG